MSRYLTPETIQQVRTIDLFSYLQRVSPQRLQRKSAKEYCLRDHDSLRISSDTGLWNWHSRNFGGRSALDFLVKVEEMSFLDAARQILDSFSIPETEMPQPHHRGPEGKPNEGQTEKSEAQAKETEVFKLPVQNGDNKRIAGYLLNKRGISKTVMDQFIKEGLLYEDAAHHNCVFVGRKPDGQPGYASLRGTSDYMKDGKKIRFVGEAHGSNTRYAFRWEGRKNPKSVHVFEGAIDMLSYATLLQEVGYAWDAHSYLITGGGGANMKSDSRSAVPVAIEQWLQTHPQTESLILHLDNDEAGRLRTKAIQQSLGDRYTIYDKPPRFGKDFNDMLLILRPQFEQLRQERREMTAQKSTKPERTAAKNENAERATEATTANRREPEGTER